MASRLGGADSGLTTIAAGWQGAVRVHLSDKNGVDMVQVSLVPWGGQGTYKVLYNGPVDGKERKRAKVRGELYCDKCHSLTGQKCTTFGSTRKCKAK